MKKNFPIIGGPVLLQDGELYNQVIPVNVSTFSIIVLHYRIFYVFNIYLDGIIESRTASLSITAVANDDWPTMINHIPGSNESYLF